MTLYGYILGTASARGKGCGEGIVRMKRFAGLVLAALGVAVSAVAQVPAVAESLAADPALVLPSSGAAYTPMSAHERWHGYLHENLLSSKFGFQLFGSAFISHLDRDPVEW